jgi:hypothetical protein
MRIIKMLVMGVLIGLLTGLWLGVNIGKGNPLLSNPFAEEQLQKKLKEKVGERIEKLGEDIKGKINK